MELKKFLFFLLILIVLLLTGCSTEGLDASIGGDDTCKAPCWNLITPGSTTKEDAVSIIEGLRDEENYGFTDSVIHFKFRTNRVQIHLDETSQLVEEIIFEVDDVNLGQLVDEFGEPRYLSFQFDSGGCTMLVHYPDESAYFMSQCKSGLWGDYWKVSKNTKIIEGFFLNPNLDEKELVAQLFGSTSASLKDIVVLWEGYGSYPE